MLKLRDIMTTDVVTVSPETTLREAAELLASRHLGGAPVTVGDHVVGVVSLHDLVAFEAAAPSPRPQDESGPAEWEDWNEKPDWAAGDDPIARFFTDVWIGSGGEVATRMAEPATPDWDPLTDRTVAEVMTRRAIALPPTADVSTAAERMRRAGIHRALVMDGRKLLGIVTTMDLTRAVADHRIGRQTFVFDRPRTGHDRHRGRL